jgi:hypothetical protein
MSKRDDDPSPLTHAVTALEAELQRFESLAEALRTAPLGTQKHLQRAGQVLSEVADADQRLQGLVQQLVAAISAARERQQHQAVLVQERALEVERRARIFQQMLQKQADLGEAAAELNRLFQGAATADVREQSPEERARTLEQLFALGEQVGKLAEAAQVLTGIATEQEFVDVARGADGLRQQLLALHNKLNLLRSKSPSC